MNPLDRLLTEEVGVSLARISAEADEGVLAFVTAREPGLRAGLEATEARLAALREELLAGYRAWQGLLADLESLWGRAHLAYAEARAADLWKSAA
jgi:hypothetical protein